MRQRGRVAEQRGDRGLRVSHHGTIGSAGTFTGLRLMDRLIISVVAGVGFFVVALWVTSLFRLDLTQIVLSVGIGVIGAVSVWIIDWLTGRTNAT